MKTDDALLGTTAAEVILAFSSTSMMQHDVVSIGATTLHCAVAPRLHTVNSLSLLTFFIMVYPTRLD
ncbi:hypothetical protein ACO0K2_12405 [Undibacterium sp. MH2W]|uniref:hypothetical protein n=1 Tax=Undibacterium sp. MH2W TaxID=3413044 RepID=UPI003BF01705